MKQMMRRLAVLSVLPALLFAGCVPDSRSNEASTIEPDDRQALQNRADTELVEENFRAVSIDSGDTLVLYTAQIRNAGDTSLLLSNVEVALVRANGEPVKQQHAAIYPDIISPGQSSYISEAVLIERASDKIEPDQIHHVNLTYSASAASHMDQTSLLVTDAGLRLEGDFPVFTARVVNTGDGSLSHVCVAAPVYSVDGELQTVIVAVIDTLEPRKAKTVEAAAAYAVADVDYRAAQAHVFAFIPFGIELMT